MTQNLIVTFIFPYLWNLQYKSADLFQYVFKFPCLFARLPGTSYLITSANWKYDAKSNPIGMSFFSIVNHRKALRCFLSNLRIALS